MPRLLSNLSDAPMFGKAAIHWQLSIQPEKDFPVKTGGSLPPYVFLVLSFVFLFGSWTLLTAFYNFRAERRPKRLNVWTPKLQVAAGAWLVLSSTVSLGLGHGTIAMVMVLVTVMVLVAKRKQAPRGTEDWPDAKPAAGPAQPAGETNAR